MMIRIITIMLILMLSSPAQAIRFKIATLSPEGSVWMQKMLETLLKDYRSKQLCARK
jgi:hypothetical protein